MKRFKKIIIAVIAFILVLGIASCGDGSTTSKIDFDSILASYLLKEDKTLVTKDFVLDNSIEYKDKNYPLTWSVDSDLVELELRSESYLVKISYPEEGYVTVTLTAHLRKATKEFTIRLKALDVFDVAGSYVFPLDKKMVGSDIELPSEVTYINKTATVTWEAEEGQDRVVIEDGFAKIYPTADESAVKLYANFELDGQTTRKTYTVLPAVQKTHDEEINYWYTNTGVSVDMSGYVVAIATAYSSQYQNVSLYMIDDNLQAGYYLYRVKTDDNNANLLVPGVHITVTGTTNTNYNGLIETNAGGSLVVDQDKDTLDVSEYLYVFDEDAIGNVPAAIYKQSIPVVLNNWKVTKVNTVAADNFKTVTAFVIEKGGAKISVALSKYLEGFYTDFVSGNGAAILEKLANIQVGDWVTVSGILGNYNGAQIILRTADDIQEGAEDTTTSFAGQKVSAAIEAVKALIPNEVHENVAISLPEANGEVAISYTLLHQSRAVKLEGNALTITPSENEDKAVIRVDYTCGEYSTFTFHTIISTSTKPVEPVEETEFVIATNPEVGKEYLLAIEQGNLNKTIYSTGEVSGNYGASTDDPALAAKFVLVEAEGGYQVKVILADESVKYMNALVSGKYTNVKFEDEATTVWTFNTEYNTLTVDTTGHSDATKDGTYYVGTYNSYETLSMSLISYASTSFPSHLGSFEVKGEEPVNVHAGTKEDPLDIADMYALTALLNGDNKEVSADKYYVKAVIATEPTTDFCNFNFVDGEMTIVVYGLAADEAFSQRFGSKRQIEEIPVKLGDEVVIRGNLQNYLGKFEVSYGQLISINGVDYVDPTQPDEPEVPGEQVHAGTEADPLDAADAILLAGKLDGTTKEISADSYYIKATIATDPTANYCNFNFVDGEKSIVVYGLAADEAFSQRFGTSREIAELPVKNGDEVVLHAQLQNYNGTLEIYHAQLIAVNGVAYVAPETPETPTDAVHAGTEADPYTGVDAKVEALKLAAGAKSEGFFFVSGQVVSEPTANYCNFNLGSTEGSILAYGLYTQDGSKAFGTNKNISELPIKLGDTIVVYAQLQNYNGTPELVNAQLRSVNGVAYEYVEPTQPEPEEGAVTIAVAANQFTGDTASEVSYTAEGIEFKVIKNTSTTAIRLQDTDHVRVYKGSQLQITAPEGKSFAKIVAYSTGGNYAQNIVIDGVQYSSENSVYTIEFENGASVVLIDCSVAQTRFNKFDIYFVGETQPDDPTPDDPTPTTPTHAGTEADPLDAADAILLAGKLDGTTKEISADSYYIKATIATDPTANYCNFNFVDGTNSIVVYGLAANAEFTQRFGTSREIAELPVKNGDEVVLHAQLQNYNGTLEIYHAQLIAVNGVAYEYVEPSQPDPEDPTTEGTVVTFALAATSFEGDSSSSASCTTEGTVFTMIKNTSTTNIRLTDTNHIRVYKGSQLSIAAPEGKAMTKIVITALSGYAPNITIGGVEYAAESLAYTIEFTTPQSSVVIDNLAAQARFSQVQITFATAE